MDTLFPMEPLLPAGFSYFPDFLEPDEEKELLHAISGVALHSFMFHGHEAKRKVASFGYDYNFETKHLTAGSPIPAAFHWLIDKVSSRTNITADRFAELLVTEYPAGAVINWHRDAPPFHIIVGISLQAACTFRLRPHDKTKQNRKSIVTLRLEPRSLYIIEGEARSDWQHSTLPVEGVRYSLTLRTLKADDIHH